MIISLHVNYFSAGVKNCLALVDSSFNELLEIKDELLQHDLPPSLLMALTLSMGKMFRRSVLGIFAITTKLLALYCFQFVD